MKYKIGDRVYFRPLKRKVADCIGTIVAKEGEDFPTILDGEAWYLFQPDNRLRADGQPSVLPEAESTLHPACAEKHCFAGISAELEDKHRHEYCTKCKYISDEAVFTVTCRDCWNYSCSHVSEKQMALTKRAHGVK